MKKFAMAIAVAALVAFAAPAFAAMNPFMDVPASHWAYDAIAQLAARGVISGYPDGTYKGARPTTRYEMASALARALAKIDMEKASKQDVEMLKKLIVEFKDELDALGVKVDQLDSRVAVLEKDLGGWSLSGHFRMDWMIGNNDGMHGTVKGKNEMDLNRYRIWLRKRINETTSFTARIGKGSRNGTAGAAMMWEHYYVTMKLPYNITLNVGRKPLDWEGDLGFYKEEEPLVGDMTFAMFQFQKDWGMANLQLVIGRLGDKSKAFTVDRKEWDFGTDTYNNVRNIEQYIVAGLANFDFTDRFRGGLMAYYLFSNGDEKGIGYNADGSTNEADMNLLTAGIYLGYKFTPAVELKGIYYYQKQSDGYQYGQYRSERSRPADYYDANGYAFDDDKANAWKVILDVNQEALKFTSLWLEYGQIDNNFETMRYGRDESDFSAQTSMFDWAGADVFANTPYNTDKTKYFFIRADQKWSNTKWRSFLRYAHVDYGTNGLSKAKQWGLGIAYRLNPAVEFELSYDSVDFGDGVYNPYEKGDDNIVRLRTFVTF